MKVYITGVSGTGKTTIAKKLKEIGIKAISIDEASGLCHWFNKTDGKLVDYKAKLDKEFIESHVWVCNTNKLKNLIDKEDQIVVLGAAENQNEIVFLFDKILLLQCKPEIFLQRIMDRKDNTFGQEKTAQNYILSTYKQFEDDMLKRGAIPISVEEPLDVVIDKIVAQIQ